MASAWGSFRKCIPVKYLCLYLRYKNPVNDPFDWQLTGIPFVLWVRSCSQWNGPPKHASWSTASCSSHHGPIDNPELCVGHIQIRDVIMCVNIKQLAIVATGMYVPVTYMHLSRPFRTSAICEIELLYLSKSHIVSNSYDRRKDTRLV